MWGLVPARWAVPSLGICGATPTLPHTPLCSAALPSVFLASYLDVQMLWPCIASYLDVQMQ
jgi:hypothetical protein